MKEKRIISAPLYYIIVRRFWGDVCFITQETGALNLLVDLLRACMSVSIAEIVFLRPRLHALSYCCE